MRPALLFALSVAAASANVSGYVVIANPSLAGVHISANDLKQIFLGTKTRAGGRRIESVVARSGSAHRQFASDCVGKTEAGLQNYFRMLVFSGKGNMPKSFATAAEMVDYVARTEGAIGYVGPDVDLSGVVLVHLK